jgi:hypothetical protein
MFNIKEWKPSLKAAVKRLEDSIITLSGPAIAVSGIIAGIDLVTGGTMFKDIAWLSLTWAICLLLTLDFQVLMLGAKAKRIYTATGKGWKRKALEIFVTVAIAAAISSVSVQMQSIIARSQATTVYTDRSGQQHTRTLTIEEATEQMGINPVALIWERSALVLILIFMSGWLRDEESRRQDDQSQAPAAPDYNQIAEQLKDQLAPQIAALKANIIAEIKPLIPAPLNYQQLARTIAPLLPEPEPAPALDYGAIAQALAPLLPTPEPGPTEAPALDYRQLAREIAPLLEPRLTEIRRVIVEEVKQLTPQIAAPTIEASTNGHHRPGTLPNGTPLTGTLPNTQEQERQATTSASDQRRSQDEQEETDEQRDARLERAYQELHTANNGKRVSGRQLAEKARANRAYCNKWLQEHHPENEPGNSQHQDTEEVEAVTEALAAVTH